MGGYPSPCTRPIDSLLSECKVSRMIKEEIVSVRECGEYTHITTDREKALHLWYGPTPNVGDTILLPHVAKIHCHILGEPDLPGGKLLIEGKGQAFFLWYNAPTPDCTEVLYRGDSRGKYITPGWKANTISGTVTGICGADLLLPGLP